MNLYNKIKYYLTEMSTERRVIQFKVINHIEEINEHLVKCLLIQDTTNTLNHWCQEICNFLSRISALKGSNKYPSKELIYSWITGWIDGKLPEYIDDCIESIEGQYNLKLDNYNKQSLNDCILLYYDWLSSMLSKYGKVKNSDVKAQINSLIQKYNSESKPKVGVTQ